MKKPRAKFAASNKQKERSIKQALSMLRQKLISAQQFVRFRYAEEPWHNALVFSMVT